MPRVSFRYLFSFKKRPAGTRFLGGIGTVFWRSDFTLSSYALWCVGVIRFDVAEVCGWRVLGYALLLCLG